MGGCVSSPKDLALNEGEEAPVESSTAPKAEAETVAQEKVQEGSENTEGEKKEEPLVDLSEPKEENVEAKVEEVKAATEAKEPEKEEAKAEEKKDEPLVTL